MGLLSAVDIALTLLQLARRPVPDVMQGTTFAGVFTDCDLRAHNAVFAVCNWHGSYMRDTKFLYKENQYPMHGGCIQNGFAYSASFKALHQVHLRGELNLLAARCFDDERDKVELPRVVESGLDLRNLADEPDYAQVRQRMAARLLA
ncbi:MAG: hypothetical protein HRT77_13155 [Halioglobus sp.]|nr:hypothetical protein [Halioglobus sp.]